MTLKGLLKRSVSLYIATFLVGCGGVEGETTETKVEPPQILKVTTTSPTGKVSHHQLEYSVVGEHAVIAGDIILGKDPLLTGMRHFEQSADGTIQPVGLIRSSGLTVDRGRSIASTSNFNVWPNYGKIPVVLAPEHSSFTVQKIKSALASVNWAFKNHDLPIGIEFEIVAEEEVQNSEVHYIRIEYSERSCASYIGKIAEPVQPLYISSRCSEGSIMHEALHALGLLHEHTRSDRDDFITILLENVDAKAAGNFDILPQDLFPTKRVGDYDYGSIMHYGEMFFSANGKPVIKVPSGQRIGQREKLSEGDLDGVASLYPGREKRATVIGIAFEALTR